MQCKWCFERFTGESLANTADGICDRCLKIRSAIRENPIAACRLLQAELHCDHDWIHNETWPDGGIQVCNICGMSRHVWEQGESNWQIVHTVIMRTKLTDAINNMEAPKRLKGFSE